MVGYTDNNIAIILKYRTYFILYLFFYFILFIYFFNKRKYMTVSTIVINSELKPAQRVWAKAPKGRVN